MKSIAKHLLAVLLIICGTTTSNSFAQTITASPDTLCFGCEIVGTSAPTQVTIVSGSYLTPSSGTLSVVAPSNFMVFNGSSWVSSYSLAYSGGFLPSTSVIVQFNPTAVTTYSGNVIIVGGGAPTRNVHVEGTGVSSMGGSCACTGTPSPGFIVARDTSGCSGFSTTLTLSNFCMSAGLSFQWQAAATTAGSWPTISGATGASLTHTFTASTYVRCAVTCSSGGTAYTAPIHLSTGLTTTPFPIAGSSTVGLYATTPLADATPGGSWSSSNPSIATVAASAAVFGLSTGTATITYTVTDACGSTFVTHPITVTGSLFESNVTATNSLSFIVSPNPAGDFTTVTFNEYFGENIVIRLVDLCGKHLISKEIHLKQTGSTTLDLSGVARGIYLLEVTGNNEKKVVKLVKG